MLFDHVDLRVRDLAAVRPFYDALCFAMGLTRIEAFPGAINYQPASAAAMEPFFGLMTDVYHVPNETRIAFRAASRAEVDRLAHIAYAAGARAFEAPGEYDGAAWYYAAFFEDPEGNRLEICFRERP